MNINFVFFGTDDFSVLILEELKKAGLLPALVVTAPDRPKGRGLKLASPIAKLWAQENTVSVLQPKKLNSSLNLKLSTFNFQLFIVASYGLIIPKHILDIPKLGALNVHPSLLPKYRGATPIENQILNEEKEIGVTIMLMDEKVDHGPIVAQTQILNPSSLIFNQRGGVPKASELRKVLAEEGGKLLADVMPKWVAGEIEAVPQDESKTTYTKKLTKADGEIDLGGDPYKNFLKVRAFEGSIGTYYYADSMQTIRGQTQKKKVRVVIKSAEFKDDKLRILRVIPEGKKEMRYEEFSHGLK